ncbi:gp436 family protein [Algimonas porphyrae]|nr:DUF1320 domain-containing protein [Algimonas porphyrae]
MYATREDIVSRFGEDVLIGAADADGLIVDARITAALEAASAEINSYVGVRHTLPLTSVPPILVEHCVVMAIYKLNSGADMGTEDMETRNKQALGWLKDLSNGRATLGLDSKPGQKSPRPVVTTGTPRQFSRHAMREL